MRYANVHALVICRITTLALRLFPSNFFYLNFIYGKADADLIIRLERHQSNSVVN
jgi:hypothetical protein